MRILLIFLTIIPISTFADWQRVDCDSTTDSGLRENIRLPNYSIGYTQKNNECSFHFRTKTHSDSNDYIKYMFKPSGHWFIFVSQGNKDGSKSYFLPPKNENSKIEVYLDSETNETKIITTSGDTFFIDPSTGLINEDKSQKYKIKQKPLSYTKSPLSISDTEKPLITFPYTIGGSRTEKMYAEIFVEYKNKSCKIKAGELFKITASGTVFKEKNQEDIYKLINQKCPSFDIPITSSSNTQIASPKLMPKPILKPTEVKEIKTELPSPRELESKNNDIEKREDSAAIDLKTNENITPPCLDLLKNFFDSVNNKEKVNQYLKNQGKISLHKIAISYLKTRKDEDNELNESLINLIKKRDPAIHEKFIKAPFKSRNTTLLEIMKTLKSHSSKDQGHADLDIQYSDLKMLELLVAAEEIHGRSSKNGVMDFVSIINNSLKDREKSESKEVINKMISSLKNKQTDFEKEVTRYLEENNCLTMKDFGVCGKENSPLDIQVLLNDSENVINSIFENQFQKKEELKNNYKWNTYWLHVGSRKN